MSLIIDPGTLSPSGWWRARDLNGVGSALPNHAAEVGQWNDVSGNGRHLTQAAAGQKPTFRLAEQRGSCVQMNNRPFVRFDGTDDFLASSVGMANFLGAEGVGTFFAVVVLPDLFDKTSFTYHPIFSAGLGGDQLAVDFSGSTVPWDCLLGFVSGTSTGPTTLRVRDRLQGRTVAGEPVNGWRVMMWQHDKVGSTHYTRVGCDNLDDAALASAVGVASGSLASVLQVGYTPIPKFFTGDMYEMIVFPTVLTEAQRRGILLYLTSVYALGYMGGLPEEGTASPKLYVEMKVSAVDAMVVTPAPRAWWKADSLALANNDPVGTWNDVSGNNFKLVQATAGRKPLFKTNVVNGKPAVLFDGSDDYLVVQNQAGTPQSWADVLGGAESKGRGTIYVCLRGISLGYDKVHVLVGNSLSDVQTRLQITDLAGSYGPTFVAAANYDGVVDSANDTNHLVEFDVGGPPVPFGVALWEHDPIQFQSAVYGGWNHFKYGTDGVAYAATGDTTDLAAIMHLGRSAADVGCFNGHVAEVLVFQEAHNAEKRLAVLAYLSKKWGVAYPYAEDPGVYWHDVTADVRATEDVSLSYGIGGGGYSDRTAATGTLELVMRNSADNSAGLVGYYSPDSPNRRQGFKLGTPVRVSLEYYGTRYYKFLGRIGDIKPAAGEDNYGSRIVAVDYMDELARSLLPKVDVQVNKRADELLNLLLYYIGRLPEAWLIHQGSDVYPFALDNAAEEKNVMLGEIQKLVMSELGYAYVRGTAVGGGELVFEPRGLRVLDPNVRWAISSGMRALDPIHSVDEIVNRAVVTLHPRRIDSAATSILFSLDSAPFVARNSSVTFEAPYRDPSNGRFVRVGGSNMVTPVAGTDYVFNTKADGSGSVITGMLTVAVTFGSSSAAVTVTNDGGGLAVSNPQDGYLTKFQLRGKGIYSFESVVANVFDAASVALYGETSKEIDMPYQSDINLGFDAASFIVAKNKDARSRVPSVQFGLNGSSVRTIHGLAREIGDRISVSETTTGISGLQYFIQGVTLNVTPEREVVCEWILAPADATDYWLLGVAGRSELGQTTILGYGSG